MSAAFTQTAFHSFVHNFIKRSFSNSNILYATKKMKQKKGFNTQDKHKGRHQKFNLKKTSEFGNEFLYGRSVCNLAILSSRRPIFKMFLNSKYEVQEPDDPRVQSSLKEAARRNIPIEFISAADMFDISSGHPHQGVCLEVGQLLPKPLCQDTMNQLLHHGPQCPLWVLLYDIIDPMNIGNILRTCHFLGVEVPIMTSQCAPISPTTSKASSGAVEVMQLYSTNRPTQF
uniref:rRNA methyltransferase 1, mitochondrial n=1 Tax=Ciona savignyi TaxID=51511 RepID=H2YFV4_CIOSA